MTGAADHRQGTRIPPGSHGIPAEVVARNQRERLIAAIAEACAEGGYAETSVADVAKRAGVSSATFYKQFAGKRECMLAAHRQLLGRLLEEVDSHAEKVGEARTEASARAALPPMALRTLLTVFAADPPSARLLTVEILALGSEGAKRHDATVEALASRLDTDWVRTAGALALIGKRVLTGEADRLPGLEDELVAALSPQR